MTQPEGDKGFWGHLLDELVIGSDRVIDQQGNWASKSTAELYEGVHRKADPEQAYSRAQEWERLGNDITDRMEGLAALVRKHTASWQGKAAESARFAISELVNWGNQAARTSVAIAEPMRKQAEIVAKARSAMPEPVAADHEDTAQAFAGGDVRSLAGGLTDAYAGSARSAAVHQQAVDVMNTMEQSSHEVDSAVPQYVPPRPVAKRDAVEETGPSAARDADPPGAGPGGDAQRAAPADKGAGAPAAPTGAPANTAPGNTAPGNTEPAATAPAPHAPAGAGPHAQGGGPAGHGGPGTSGRPDPAGAVPGGPGPERAPGGGGGEHRVPVDGQTTPAGARPASVQPGSTGGPSATARPGGGRGGIDVPAEPADRVGWRGDIASTLGGSGSSRGGGSGIGNRLGGSGGSASPLQEGGRTGAAAGGGRVAPTAGRTGAAGGSGGPGMAGAPGGRGNGNADREHKRKGYLQDEDELFAVPEADRLPPPVIGGTPKKKRPKAPDA